MEKFLGFPYPIRKNSLGFLYSESGINQIKADMLQLLLTNPGERVMLPQFGTPLRRLIFEPNDPQLAEKAKNMIISSLKLFEPRIAVQNIEVSNNINRDSLNDADALVDIENILSIRIIFVDPENISEVQELKLEMPLAIG